MLKGNNKYMKNCGWKTSREENIACSNVLYMRQPSVLKNET